MINFIKNQVVKVATLAIIAGVGLACVGLWQMFEERNVASDPEVMDFAGIKSPGDELLYATVSGGTLDLTNTFEYSIGKRKRQTKLLKNYFVPVTDAQGSVKYVLQTNKEPGSLDLSSVTYTGLLQNSSDLPGKIADGYSSTYPGQSFPYLDATYKPKSMAENLTKVVLFLGLAVVGFVIRMLMRRKPHSQLAMN